jgi:hypothetical protein
MARLTFADLQARRDAPPRVPDKPVIKVGMSTCGLAAGSESVFDALRAGGGDVGDAAHSQGGVELDR